MKHRPILFSTEMVRAILEGRKTQTRRIVKLADGSNPTEGDISFFPDGSVDKVMDFTKHYPQWVECKCPYGQPGDVLWVRETWAPAFNDYAYKADYSEAVLAEPKNKGLWKPSIHMPREAARLFLCIKSDRVERLQDIDEEDAISEGIKDYYSQLFQEKRYKDYLNLDSNWRNPISSFDSLWQSIHGPGSWDANPLVWVIEFERISKEEAGI